MMLRKLGILAGGGNLPHEIIKACQEKQIDFFVVAFDGQTNPTDFLDIPNKRLRLGAAGTVIKYLKTEGCHELIFAGSIKKPGLNELRPDFWTSKFLARNGGLGLGDNSILSALIHDLEAREGFRVVGVDELVPNLIANPGVYGNHRPDQKDYKNISAGIEGAIKLSGKDKGQACVVRNGNIIGLEDHLGTDCLLDRIATENPPEGVLVKIKQANQEYRIDLPTIGPKTVEKAAAAGLRGIAVEAGRALVIDRNKVISLLNNHKLFLLGITQNDP